MKLLNLWLIFALIVGTTYGQVNVQQAPGAYTDSSVVVRDGTGKNVKNVPTLVFNASNILTAGGASATGAGVKIYTNTNETSSLTLQGGSRYFTHLYAADVYSFSGRDSDTYPIYSFANDGSYRFAFASGITVGADMLDISGVNTFAGSTIRTPNTVTITEGSPDTATWTITNGNEVATIDEATTFDFSAVGTAGQIFRGTIINSTGGALIATLTGCTPSTTTVAASSTQYYAFESNGSAWVMPGGDPYAPLPLANGGTGATSAGAAATALGLGTGDSPQLTAVNLGHATDTTITRVSAGVVAVEGNNVATDNRIDTNAELRAITVGLGAVVQANSSTFAAPDTTTPRTLTAADCYGFILYYGATGTINLPAGVTGMNGLIYNTGAFTITIDPNGSEVVVRDGAAQTGGVSFTLSSGAGNYVAIHFDGTRWVTLGYKGTLAVGS